MSLSRRQALQLVVMGSISTTGCLGQSPEDGTATEPATDSEPPAGTVLELGESYESPGGTTVTVHSARLRRLVRSTSVGSASHIDVAWLDGHQFAVTDVEATGPTSKLGSEVPLALSVDGTQYPLADQHWYWTYPPGTHMGATDRRMPAYPAPITDAERASIVWLRDDPVSWRLPEDTVAELRHPPSFEVSSFTTPESISRGSPFEATFTVRNTGAEGRFVAEFGAGPLSDHGEVTVSVPADSERTYTATMDPHYPENTSTVQVVLDWGKTQLERTVSVE